jgi:hypothetical protein
MCDITVIWDEMDNPRGNYRHIVERHSITVDEVEEILGNYHSQATTSRSSGRPITFGWTSTNKYIAVVYEHVRGDPYTLYPVTAYPTTPPKVMKHGR